MKKQYAIMLFVFVVSAVLISCSGQGGSVTELEGTDWLVIEVMGETVRLESAVSMSFSDGMVGGSAPCNHYFADFTQDGDQLKFGIAGSTMMFCEEAGVMEMEAMFFKAVEVVQRFIEVDGQLQLFDEEDMVVLVLRKK